MTYNCEQCGDDYIRLFCIAEGKYCPFWPTNVKVSELEITKENLLKENIRTKCIN